MREAQEYWSGWPFPSPGDLPDLGTEPGSPALQVDSLPAELPGKPTLIHFFPQNVEIDLFFTRLHLGVSKFNYELSNSIRFVSIKMQYLPHLTLEGQMKWKSYIS